MANDLCVAFHGELLVIKTPLWAEPGGTIPTPPTFVA
jgi:hypothetical protein